MITKYFQCHLKTDIVLNASLATEGNMRTLDYIPGSNFLGIVAAKRYKQLPLSAAYDIFHSGKVSFGDAHIAEGLAYSYQIPFSYLMEKLKQKITQDSIWVHHHLQSLKIETSRFKQQREGFINRNSTYIKRPKKSMAIKSAYDRNVRASKSGAMFGLQSLSQGQTFIFAIHFSDTKYIKQVTQQLVGKNRIGKSRNAQYGQVEIKELESPPLLFENREMTSKQLVIYAESNLCLLNEYGQSTFQPEMKDFGLSKEYGDIDWKACKIRTYSYSHWNAHRNTGDTPRDVIQKGSVFVLKLKEAIPLKHLPKQIGIHHAEGLGRILYNPAFLDANANGLFTGKFQQATEEAKSSIPYVPSTPLSYFLSMTKTAKMEELTIGKAVIEFMKMHKDKFVHIPPSQWGAIRSKAIAASNMESLHETLFGVDQNEEKKGFLKSGVAADRYWNKSNGICLIYLEQTLIKNKSLGTKYIAKLAAEMAKLKQVNHERRKGKILP